MVPEKVNVAIVVSLSVMPVLKALALSVVVLLTDIELEYCVDEDVGLSPLVVYRIIAPEVAQLIVTD